VCNLFKKPKLSKKDLKTIKGAKNKNRKNRKQTLSPDNFSFGLSISTFLQILVTDYTILLQANKLS
jgi:hypothetical protein